jgi:glycyl-tRNA synthetase beta chain
MNEARQVNVAILKEPSEQELFDAAQSMLPDVAHHAAMYDYPGLYRALLPLRPIVDKFFDDVLVMAPDAAVRRNRLELLEFIDALYKTLADFTKVVVA